MKIVLVLGSRNREGRTARAGRAVLEGARRAGALIEEVFLPEVSIERCRQCNATGWGICRSEGRCVIGDDFTRLTGKLRQADALVFATPVYFSDLSESMRAFLDRLRRVTRHESGKPGVLDKPAVGVCVAGGGGGGAVACAAVLERTLATCGYAVADLIPVRRQNLESKLAALAAVGGWLVTGTGEEES